MHSTLRYSFRQRSTLPGFTALAVLMLALAMSGCTLVTDYQIAEGAKMQRSYRSIAGSVHIGRDAAIHRAKTIAGSIHVNNGATTRSLSSVAGEIRIGESVNVDGDISTIAGNIRIDARTRVTGEVTSIAGAMELSGCRVEGLVRVTKSSLSTRDATRLPGGIFVRHASSGDDKPVTRIDLGPGADVASINVEPDTTVDVRISREAHVGKVTGTTPTYY